MGLICRLCQKVKPDSVRGAWLFLLTRQHAIWTLSYELLDPLGGVGVQPSTHAGTGQTAASGEGERGVTDSPEARTKKPSTYL